MTRIIDVIYENGVLKPIKPLEGLDEHRRIRVTLSDDDTSTSRAMEECFGRISPENASKMEAAIEEAFERVNLDDWR